VILSHKQIEEIAVAVTKDFNEFLFGKDADNERSMLRQHRLTSCQGLFGLSVSFAHLSSDGSLCGLTAYADTEYTIEEHGIKQTIPLKANQVLLDLSFIQPGQFMLCAGSADLPLPMNALIKSCSGWKATMIRNARKQICPQSGIFAVISRPVRIGMNGKLMC
jgi:hypothetical protein